MENQKSLKSVFAGRLGMITLFAIVGQFILSAHTSKLDRVDYIIQFFSYFTILSNVMVMLCCFFTICWSKSRMGLFFTSINAKTKCQFFENETFIKLTFSALNLYLCSLREL